MNQITATEQDILALMESCRDMAVSLARPYAKREHVRVDHSDALCNAMYHLWQAARGFSKDRGFQFSTYAHHSISRGLKRDYLRGRGVRIVSGKRVYVGPIESEESIQECRLQPDIELADLEQDENNIRKIQNAVQFIGDRNQEVLLRRMAGEGMKEIGVSLGVSKQRVEQIEKNAIKEIRVRCGLRECGRAVG